MGRRKALPQGPKRRNRQKNISDVAQLDHEDPLKRLLEVVFSDRNLPFQ